MFNLREKLDCLNTKVYSLGLLIVSNETVDLESYKQFGFTYTMQTDYSCFYSSKNKKNVKVWDGIINSFFDNKCTHIIIIEVDLIENQEFVHELIDKCIENPEKLILPQRDRREIKRCNSLSGLALFVNTRLIKFSTGGKIKDFWNVNRIIPLKYYAKLNYKYNSRHILDFSIVQMLWKKVSVEQYKVETNVQLPQVKVQKGLRLLLYQIRLILSGLYIRPLRFISDFSWKKFKKTLKKEIYNSEHSNIQIALSFGFGGFMGTLPIWGYQTITALTLSHKFKLNKLLVFMGTMVSFGPLMPIIMGLSYYIGQFFTGRLDENYSLSLDYFRDDAFSNIASNVVIYILGSIILGLIIAFVFTTLLWILLIFIRKSPKN